MNKQIIRGLALVGAVALGNSAHAAGTDFSALTAAVDFSSVGAAILAIGALLAAPAVIKRGTKIVLGMIGR